MWNKQLCLFNEVQIDVGFASKDTSCGGAKGMDGCRLRMVEERGASKASVPSASQRERVDRRVLRSRAAMVAAFEDLLAEKAYEDITVTDIARKADVDRKTFYKHFGSIDGLLAYVLDSHIDDIVENTHGLLACTGESEQGGFAVRIQVFFEMVNRAIMENISLKRRVFECVPFDLMFTCIKQSMYEELERYCMIPASVRSDQLDYYLSFVFGGILSAYRQWIMMGGDTPIENVSSAASALVARGLSSLEGFEPAESGLAPGAPRAVDELGA